MLIMYTYRDVKYHLASSSHWKYCPLVAITFYHFLARIPIPCKKSSQLVYWGYHHQKRRASRTNNKSSFEIRASGVCSAEDTIFQISGADDFSARDFLYWAELVHAESSPYYDLRLVFSSNGFTWLDQNVIDQTKLIPPNGTAMDI